MHYISLLSRIYTVTLLSLTEFYVMCRLDSLILVAWPGRGGGARTGGHRGLDMGVDSIVPYRVSHEHEE